MNERIVNDNFKRNLIYYVVKYLNDDDKTTALEMLIIQYKKFITDNGKIYNTEFKPRSFAQYLLELATLPIKDIFSSDELNKLNSNNAGFILENEDRRIVDEFGEIDENFKTLYYNFSNLREDEQLHVRDVVYFLRDRANSNPSMQKVYDVIRNALCFKVDLVNDLKPLVNLDERIPLDSYNIWTSQELDIFKLKLLYLHKDLCLVDETVMDSSLKKLIDIFMDCFDLLENTESIKVCKACGLPVKVVNGVEKCVSSITCSYHPYHGKSPFVVKKLDKNQRYYVVKEGIQWSITRTGIEEYFSYLYIIKVCKDIEECRGVTQYPGLDAKGDALIDTILGDLSVDVKDYESAKSLIKKIQEKPSAFSDKDIIFIPKYRYKLYQASGDMKKIQDELEKLTVNGRHPLLATEIGNGKYALKRVIKIKIDELRKASTNGEF